MKHMYSFAAATVAAMTMACGGSTRGEQNASNTAARTTNTTDAERNGSAPLYGGESRVAAGGTTGGERMTLTGCLTPGGEHGSYVLRMAGGDAGSGTSSQSTAALNGAYRIIADNPGELAQNVNARVTVEGYVQGSGADMLGTSGSSAGGASGTGGVSGSSGVSGATGMSGTSGNRGPADSNGGSGATTPPASTSGVGADSGMRQIRAASIRKISDQCSAGESAAGR